ncbi:programmed cell death protein 6 [Tetranychus urticae]|uniref:EF-hand domain-containing protein n=1 Tax=Tetranychus urticae TaxID=32264 RepID=T1KZG4_TETUR|nr:programmed cell death protein 6 [Tetranychus urticae]
MAYKMPDQRWLYDLFRRVDRDGSGAINANELQSALSNGTWSAFNGETVRLMIGMFDKDRNGSINYQEFVHLWDYVTRWLNCFKSFDRDNSGNIDREELKQALTTFGYRLSDSFYSIIIRKFDRKGAGSIYFDDFIQLCVLLQSLTAAFRQHDTDQDGWIQIDYERFLTMVFDVCIV